MDKDTTRRELALTVPILDFRFFWFMPRPSVGKTNPIIRSRTRSERWRILSKSCHAAGFTLRYRQFHYPKLIDLK
ncbi:hypothetical protein [Nostoc sp.]|uniref:hypothetical protein n=1 Tax=Nostoc sp. TaxID=1180 RepID=UPI002FFAB414